MRHIKSWLLIPITRKRGGVKFLIFTAFFLIAGGGQVIGGEFIDPDNGTQYEIMVPFTDLQNKGPLKLHKCGGSSFMVGVHVKNNRFLCEDGVGWFKAAYQPSDITTNSMPPKEFERYESHGMAACPPGKAMVGLHAGRNVLLCAPLQVTDLFVDSHTYRQPEGAAPPILGSSTGKMHACPKGSVMVGIHDGRDLLLCGRVPQRP